jgi:hypothetical protein
MKEKILLIAKMIGLTLLFSAVSVTCLSGLFQWSWNIVLPELFGLPRIGYLQSVGVLALITILGLVGKGSSIRFTHRTTY